VKSDFLHCFMQKVVLFLQLWRRPTTSRFLLAILNLG